MKFLLSEIARTSSGVEIVLDDPHSFRGCDAKNVTRDNVTWTDRIIDDQHCQLVTSRAINPDELAVFQQTFAGFCWMKPDQGTPLRVARLRCDIVSDEQPGPKLFDHASKLGGAAAIVALPTAT